MKTFEESTYYELLDIASDASPCDVHQAYKEAYELYHDNSLASYSFFSHDERRKILTEVDKAYATLMDAKSRAGYDQLLIQGGPLRKDVRNQGDQTKMNPMVDAKSPADNTALRTRDRLQPIASSNPVIQEILAQDTLSGENLKKIRVELGVSLKDIADITKVRIFYVQAIENDEFEKTPARIFLKGFLKAYAQCMGLDAETVANRYTKRMDG